MKLACVKNYSWFRSDVRDDLSKPLLDPISDPVLIETSDKNQAVLEAIYAVDPISGFPTGDISCYVSDKTSPEIKQWILQNLMIDVSRAQLPSAPSGVGDEVIEALMRNSNESLESYAQRVTDYMHSEVDRYNQFVRSQQKPSDE